MFRKKTLSVALTFLALTLLAALPAFAEKVVSMAMTNTYETLNPYGTPGLYTDVIADQVFDRLLTSNLDGSTEPRLAESYEVDPGHGYIIYHLNKNARFHDGVPVTADDVVYSMRLAAHPDFRSMKRSNMHYIAGTNASGVAEVPEELGIEKIDDHTVKLTFKEKMYEGPILTLFNRAFYILPEHIFSKYTPEELNSGELWKSLMIGSGPMKFDSAVDGGGAEVVANKDYYLGAPDFDRLVLRVVETSQLLAGLLTGEIDILGGSGIASLSLADWPMAKDEPGLAVYSGKTYMFQVMIFNTQSPKMPSAKVRFAINSAIDRQVIVDSLLEGEAGVMYGPYQEYHPYYTPGLKEPRYDPAAARKMLEEEGFDFDQELDLIVPVGNEIRVQSTVLIQQDLAAIGVKAKITQYDFATLMQKMRKGEFDLGMIGGPGSVEPIGIYGWLNSKGGTNFPCLKDSTYTDMFEDAIHETDPALQREKYAKIQALVSVDSPIAYLYSQNNLIAYNSRRLSNLDLDKFNQMNWNVWEWKVAD